MKKIVLASTSLLRKELLERMGIPFTIDSGDFEEDIDQELPPEDLVKVLALGKAKAIARRHANSIIIGCDLVIAIDKIVLGKPHTAKKAKEMLMLLSGREHLAYCGYAILDTSDDRIVQETIKAIVSFRALSEQEIEDYVATGEPLDKAGAYAIQGMGGIFVEKIAGDYNAILGLPLCSLMESLKDFGIKPFVKK